MSIKLSVIIPVYGVEKYIEKCSISLFEQSLQEIEYIFVNDCTKDDSIIILQNVIKKYPQVKDKVKIIDHVKNLGQSGARNTGLKHAQGEYIIHLDSDDWLDFNVYEKMYELAKNNDACIVCCGIKLIYKNRIDVIDFKGGEQFLNLNKMNFGLLYSSLCNKMIKRELYYENNIFPYEGINMWEDLGIMTRLRYFANKVVFLNEELYYNYNKQNESSIVSIPKEDNIKQQIKCAELLEIFFEDNKQDLNLVVSYLKFMAKSDYLYNSKMRNIKKWQTIYKETHKNIFKFTSLSKNMKYTAWLADKNYLKLLQILLGVRNLIINLKK